MYFLALWFVLNSLFALPRLLGVDTWFGVVRFMLLCFDALLCACNAMDLGNSGLIVIGNRLLLL